MIINFKQKYFFLFTNIFFLYTILSCTSKQQSNESQNSIFPNVWSERQIFAFSALDGETNYNEPFTTILLGTQLGIRLQNPGYINETVPIARLSEKHPLWFAIEIDGIRYETLPGYGENSFDEHTSSIITSSVINTTVRKDDVKLNLKLIFADREKIIGQITVNKKSKSIVNLIFNNISDVASRFVNNSLVLEKSDFRTILKVDENANYENNTITYPIEPGIGKVINFSFSIDYNNKPKGRDSENNFAELYSERIKPYESYSLKGKQTDEIKKTYLKAFSVLRANTESAIGNINYMWTTLDRIPHRKMWLWDSGLHAMGIKYFNDKWAEDAIKAVLDYQFEDGFIPHLMEPEKHSQITQPPILAWSVWDVYKTTKNKSFLEYSYPRLKKFLEWIEINRDINNNGLFEWTHGDESGMDNSPRFDKEKIFDAIDFSCFMVNDYDYIGKIADEMGRSEEAEYFNDKKRNLIKNINNNLWDKERSFYYDKYFEGDFSNVKSIASFLPLFAKVADKHKSELLIAELIDESLWWTNLPSPSVSLEDEAFGTNMWRGPVWINYSYFNYIGLKNYGYDELATDILKKNTEAIAKWYLKEGSIFEYYDPLDVTSPKLLPRKSTKGAILEYGWSCSLFIRMVHELNKLGKQ